MPVAPDVPLSVLDLAPICGNEMIAAANTIQGAADIALAKPYLAHRLARAIVEVRHAHYQRPECRQVAAGRRRSGPPPARGEG